VSACPSEEADELPFVGDADTLVPRPVQLAPRVLARHHVVRVLAPGSAGARADGLAGGPGLLAGEPLQAAGEDEALPGQAAVAVGGFGDDLDAGVEERIDRLLVPPLGEKVVDGACDGGADPGRLTELVQPRVPKRVQRAEVP